MKSLKIETSLIDGKIASLFRTKGIDGSSVEDHLLLLGMIENLKRIIERRLEVLCEKKVKHGRN